MEWSSLVDTPTPSWCHQNGGLVIGIILALVTSSCTIGSLMLPWSQVALHNVPHSTPSWMSLIDIIRHTDNDHYVIDDVGNVENAHLVTITLIVNGVWLLLTLPYVMYLIVRPSVDTPIGVSHGMRIITNIEEEDELRRSHRKRTTIVACLGIIGLMRCIALAVALIRVEAFDVLSEEQPLGQCLYRQHLFVVTNFVMTLHEIGLIGLICGMVMYGVSCMTTIASCLTTCPLLLTPHRHRGGARALHDNGGALIISMQKPLPSSSPSPSPPSVRV
jgi:hypothetical protein